MVKPEKKEMRATVLMDQCLSVDGSICHGRQPGRPCNTILLLELDLHEVLSDGESVSSLDSSLGTERVIVADECEAFRSPSLPIAEYRAREHVSKGGEEASKLTVGKIVRKMINK